MLVFPSLPMNRAYEDCFKNMADDQCSLIIIADAKNRPEIQAAKSLLDCECGFKLLVLANDYALEMAGRPVPIYHCITHSDGEFAVKKVISGEENRDLVTTFDLARGYESEVVIDAERLIEVSSRSCGQVTKLFFHKFLSMVCVAKAIKDQNHGHECDEMFKRENRPKVNFDQAALIKARVEKLGLCFHETFKSPYGYFSSQNPILQCISEQLNLSSSAQLLNEIVQALKVRKIVWRSSKLIGQDEWIEKMSISDVFYRNHANDIQEMNEYEDILMDLSSQFLGRSIQLFPFLENELQKSFGGSQHDSILLLGCVQPWFSNFFLSVTRPL